MYQDATSKQWYPATIISFCAQPRNYNITTREGVTYRKTHAHLKPYQPQNKGTEDEHFLSQFSDIEIFKTDSKKFNTVDNQAQSHTRPRSDIKPPVKLDLCSSM